MNLTAFKVDFDVKINVIIRQTEFMLTPTFGSLHTTFIYVFDYIFFLLLFFSPSFVVTLQLANLVCVFFHFLCLSRLCVSLNHEMETHKH